MQLKELFKQLEADIDKKNEMRFISLVIFRGDSGGSQITEEFMVRDFGKELMTGNATSFTVPLSDKFNLVKNLLAALNGDYAPMREMLKSVAVETNTESFSVAVSRYQTDLTDLDSILELADSRVTRFEIKHNPISLSSDCYLLVELDGYSLERIMDDSRFTPELVELTNRELKPYYKTTET